MYVRDTSGKRREVTRVSPLELSAQGRAVPDRTGQRALEAVLRAAVDIRAELDEALSDSMAVRELWEHYRELLISLGRTEGTLDRYADVAKMFDTAFGGRRLFEVSTSVVEAFLTKACHAKGP
ncbi:hypothetical protein ACWFPY_05605 [Nocardia fluminea]